MVMSRLVYPVGAFLFCRAACELGLLGFLNGTSFRLGFFCFKTSLRRLFYSFVDMLDAWEKLGADSKDGS
jgi:hypothetical protein